MVAAFVLINAEPRRIAALAQELADVPGVAEVYSTAGDADLVAVVRVRQHDELAEVVFDAWLARAGKRAREKWLAERGFDG